LGAALDLRPDLILLEVFFPMLNGLKAGQQVKAMLPSTKLVYLTMNVEAKVAVEAFTIGASGYLLKTCASAELEFAIGEVIDGKAYLSRAFPASRSIFCAGTMPSRAIA
jgi:DNA-binding NarL/FixJ family response regulator